MDFSLNISRFHPLLVHLPIGILFLTFFLEVWKRARKKPELDVAIHLALLVATIMAVGSAATGWGLGNEGGYEDDTLFWHRWLGISLTAIAAFVFVAHRQRESWGKKLYFPFMALSLPIMAMVGHLGGNMTHGEDYLFTQPNNEPILIEDVAAANTYEVIIQPIFNAKCTGCHNETKAKGELIMTSYAALLKGGESGAAFVAHTPDESELLKRIHLDMDDDKHMPPSGKRQLDREEIALLEWWLENKGCGDCLVEEMQGNEDVQEILDGYEKTELDLLADDLDEIDQDDLNDFASDGIQVSRVAIENPFVIVNLANRQDLSEAFFDRLSDIGANVLELNLAGSNFSDLHAKYLKEFPHLRKLQIQNTAITDETPKQFPDWTFLTSLNLYRTKISDTALPDIARQTALTHLYLWQSEVSPTAISQLQSEHPDWEIQYELDRKLFGENKLNSPLIKVGATLFRDSIEVSLVSSFKGTQIVYSLDGSDPAENGLIYQEPIYVSRSAEVKTRQFREGWLDSPIASQRLVKSDYAVASVKLIPEPSSKYSAEGGESLVDLLKGSTRHTDGLWLGYEAQHMNGIFDLGEAKSVNQVVVSALSTPGAWIFFPRKINILVSKDGRNYRKLGEKAIAPLPEDQGSELKYFSIDFPATEARYVKVEVKSPLKNPKWHPFPGRKSWIFIDEIIINGLPKESKSVLSDQDFTAS
ncbi:MAG: c-type cytochrome domain-containing protein [Bacteroidota bacterium]